MGDDRPRLAGAVLTGGSSRRMGRDKALIEVDGRPLAARVVTALEDAGCTSVTCIGGDLDALAAAGLPAVADRYPGQGPLGGVLAALTLAEPGDIVVVLAVDLAQPDTGAIRAVASALDDGADVALPSLDGHRQWMHGAWRRETTIPHLAQAFEAGERSVHGAAEGLRIHEVVGLDPRHLADLDRPEDLTALEAHR